MFFHNYTLLMLLRVHKEGIFHYGRALDMDDYNSFLFFFGKVYHKNVVRDLSNIKDSWISRKNSNIKALFHYTNFYIEYSSS